MVLSVPILPVPGRFAFPGARNTRTCSISRKAPDRKRVLRRELSMGVCFSEGGALRRGAEEGGESRKCLERPLERRVRPLRRAPYIRSEKSLIHAFKHSGTRYERNFVFPTKVLSYMRLSDFRDPFKTSAIPRARDQNINRANLYENEMVKTYRDCNCSGASPNREN